MDTFNSMRQPPLSSVTPGDAMGLGPGMVDEFVFGESLMDNTHSAFPTLPFTPTYDFQDFSTGFEDPFSYSAQQYEIPASAEDPNQESSSHELDDKLLGFSNPVIKASLVDETGQHVDISMTAELRGMFFVAEDVFGGENTGRPLELTCYRRNLWQCLGEVTMPRHVAGVIDEQGNQVPLVELSASISAIESIEGKPTEIISIPWKSANPIPGEEYRASNAPPNFFLDLSTGREVDANRITLDMSWKRLQFKHATANNGRRKGLQQHYIVQIILLARQQSGDWIRVAEIQSSPVIVRGRSPRNFDSKKNIPLAGDKKPDRRSNSDASASSTRKDINGHATPTPRLASIGSAHQGAQHAGDWTTPQAYRVTNGGQPAPKRLAMSPTVARPPVPAWSAESARPTVKSSAPGPATSGPHRAGTSGPINLSLSEDERSPKMSSTDFQSPQHTKAVAVAGPTSSQSPKDDEDMLYEYFPLSVDDWMPPVEAVYRPHVVHHTTMPADVKAQQLQSKLKRYFTAET
ncbi:hypothetical protein ACRALDRAFT_1064327, partial [Sodiomyces alcalophilus JCM 7366]|uniref:uncharacterized protein n=1 Tax=Sodiomyces alcalophilus JCM 7366 TaxID=591952 RepID=UPI0039B415FB